MRELALFEQYLLVLRLEKLQLSHSTLMSDLSNESAQKARLIGQEADGIGRLLVVLRSLSKDPGLFIQEYLK